jgi:ketosteroid isomerase-like protein
MMSDLNRLRDMYRTSVEAFIQGDPAATKLLWSRRDDVTLANPLGPPVRGFEQVCQVVDSSSALIREGDGFSFACITFVETSDLAYEVGIERCTAKIGGASEQVQLSLRVTTAFRREDDGWKIVHRHADPITDARPVESVA